MTGRAIAAVACAAIVVAALAVVTARAGGAGDAGRDAGAAIAKGTARVTRTTLVEEESFDGTLGFGATRRVGVQGAAPGGTVTALAPEGSVVDRGGVLWEVDGRPTRLLFGDRPLWRPLAEGMSAGPDVRQLEENLVALGHASAKTLTVDDEFTAGTAAAVKRWEKATAAPEDGRVDPGEAVFLPGAARVAAKVADPGAPAGGGDLLEVTPVAKAVTFSLAASRRAIAAPGTRVEVELPGGSRVGATVASVATKASSPADGGAPQVEVVATLDAGTADALDSAPVEVHVVRDRAEDVLAVPVAALLALAEGGYAVELVGTAGATRFVRVETGTFARGLVEVSGEGLAEGSAVAVPK